MLMFWGFQGRTFYLPVTLTFNGDSRFSEKTFMAISTYAKQISKDECIAVMEISPFYEIQYGR